MCQCCRWHGPCARIGTCKQANSRVREQFTDIWRTYCAVDRTTDFQHIERIPVTSDLVRIFAVRTGVALNLVARIPETEFKSQILEERRVLNQRNNRFAENVTHRVLTGDWQRWATLTGTVAIDVRQVRLGCQRFLTPFTTDNNLYGFVSKRAGETEVAVDGTLNDGFFGGTGQNQRNADIGSRRRSDTACIENVVGNARRVTAGANRVGERTGNQQRFVDTGVGHVVTVHVGNIDLAELGGQIIAEVFVDGAAHTGDNPELVEADVVETRTAFDVTLTNQDINCTRSTDAWTPGTAARCGGQGCISQKKWVVAVYGANTEERARRSNLGLGAVIHEHRVEIRHEMLVDFVLRHYTSGVTLRGTPVIVKRRKVKRIAQRNIRNNRVGRR